MRSWVLAGLTGYACCTAAAGAQQQMLPSGSPYAASSGTSFRASPEAASGDRPVNPAASLPSAPAAPTAADPGASPAFASLPLGRNFHIAPAATQSDVPEKISYYLHSAVSVRNFAEAVAIAGVPDITSAPSQPIAPADPTPASEQIYQRQMNAYGDAMDVWRRGNDVTLRYHAARFEVGMATAETRQFLSDLALPLALHQQAQYLPAAVDASFGGRMWNALSSIAVTRNDAGYLVPNYSKLGGTVAAAYMGKSLFASTFNAPELDSGHFVEHYIGYSLLGDLATNTAHELVRAARQPDMDMYALKGSARDDSYYPLSLGGKVILWGQSTYALRNFVTGALMAGVPQVGDQPIEPQPGTITTQQQADTYNNAYQAWGTAELAWKQNLETDLRYRERKFIGGFSESETQMLAQNLVLPIAFDMDPRYLPLGPGYSAGRRVGHALRGLVMTHTDNGAITMNAPLLGGTVGAAYLAKELYYPMLGVPELESNGVLAKTIGLNLVADAIGNLYTEFFGRPAD
jgi:hypothetical protein